MHIESDLKLDFGDVLLRPKRSTIVSRKDVDLHRTFTFKHSGNRWTGIPIISANMASVTTLLVACAMNRHEMLACLPKTIPYENTMPGTYIPSFGLKPLPVLISDFICLDVANGYMERFVGFVKDVRARYSGVLIAGNVVTPEMTEALILAGADIVKVGLGSGAACSTRLLTGVGYPQLSAVIECADAAHGLGGHIISDGGCTTVGDIVKAFAAGADFVMLGSLLAGHEENGQEFYGSASRRAVEEHAGGLQNYRAAEGLELTVPANGKLDTTLQEICGGIRSACAYVGSTRLKSLPKCATLVRVTQQANTSMWKYRT